MRGYMFRNRWFALLFVGITLAGVTRLIGTENGGGALDKAAAELVAQKRSADASVAPSTPPAAAEVVEIEFTPDEELIDPAAGEDPTPVDEFAQTQDDPAAVPHDEIIIVSREVAETAPGPAQR